MGKNDSKKYDVTVQERRFVKEWLANGFNQCDAYLKAFPHVSRRSAGVLGCKMMKRPRVQAYVEEIKSSEFKATIANREYLIREAHEIGTEARLEKNLKVALDAVNTKGKLNHVFKEEEKGKGGYIELLKSLVVVQGDVNINNGDDEGSDNMIDITPVEDE